MSLTLQTLLAVLQDAIKLLGELLGRTNTEIESMIDSALIAAPPCTARHLFTLPADMLLQILTSLRTMDISRMDVAVSARDARGVFLSLIRSRQYTTNIIDIKDKKGCLTWMYHRGIHLNGIDISRDIAYGSLVKAEQLTTLRELTIFYSSNVRPCTTILSNITGVCRLIHFLLMSGSRDAWGYLDSILANNPNITSLYIIATESGDPVSIDVILRGCKHLVCFNVEAQLFELNTEEALAPLLNLTTLSIDTYSRDNSATGNFEDRCLIRLAEAAPNLQRVTTSNCMQLTNHAYNILGAKCKRLKEFCVNYPSDQVNVAQMLQAVISPSLRSILIVAQQRVVDVIEMQALEQIFVAHGTGLVSLFMTFASDLRSLACTILTHCSALNSLALSGRKGTGEIPLILPAGSRHRLRELHLETVFELAEFATASAHLPDLAQLRLSLDASHNNAVCSALDIVAVCMMCPMQELLQVIPCLSLTLMATNDADTLVALESMHPTRLRHLSLCCVEETLQFMTAFVQRCPSLIISPLPDPHHECDSQEMQGFLSAIARGCHSMKSVTFRNSSSFEKEQIRKYFAQLQKDIQVQYR